MFMLVRVVVAIAPYISRAEGHLFPGRLAAARGGRVSKCPAPRAVHFSRRPYRYSIHCERLVAYLRYLWGHCNGTGRVSDSLFVALGKFLGDKAGHLGRQGACAEAGVVAELEGQLVGDAGATADEQNLFAQTFRFQDLDKLG